MPARLERSHMLVGRRPQVSFLPHMLCGWFPRCKGFVRVGVVLGCSLVSCLFARSP